MSDLARELRRHGAPAEHQRGVVESVDPLTVLVQGQPVLCDQVGPYRPQPGDPVAVVRANGAWLCLGWVPARGLPSTAVVTATSVAGKPGYLAAEDEHGHTVQALYFGASPPAVSSVVGLDWSGSTPRVLGVTQSVVPVEPPEPSAPDAALSGEVYFPAVESASYRSGSWWTDKPAQYRWPPWPEDHGAWFYGGAPRQQIGGAVVEYASMYLHRVSGGAFGAQPLHLYHHTSDNKAGALSYTVGPFDVPLTIGQAGHVQIPNTLAQAVVDHGGGVGIKGAPYVVMASKAVDAQSGTLFIKWRK